MKRTGDVIIVGGGVIGLTTAYFLGKEGVSVIVSEQGKTGMEASWAGAGILPPSDLAHAKLPLDCLRAISGKLFPELAARFEGTHRRRQRLPPLRRPGVSRLQRPCRSAGMVRPRRRYGAPRRIGLGQARTQPRMRSRPGDPCARHGPAAQSLAHACPACGLPEYEQRHDPRRDGGRELCRRSRTSQSNPHGKRNTFRRRFSSRPVHGRTGCWGRWVAVCESSRCVGRLPCSIRGERFFSVSSWREHSTWCRAAMAGC